MKALELLKQNLNQIKIDREHNSYMGIDESTIQQHNDAIEELEVFIGNYQSINRKLNNTVTTMATIQNDNSSLVKILNKMGKEINDLKKEIRELKCRSCATCKHGFNHQFGDDIECGNFGADTQGIYFEKDFYCKNWESK